MLLPVKGQLPVSDANLLQRPYVVIHYREGQ